MVWLDWPLTNAANNAASLNVNFPHDLLRTANRRTTKGTFMTANKTLTVNTAICGALMSGKVLMVVA